MNNDTENIELVDSEDVELEMDTAIDGAELSVKSSILRPRSRGYFGIGIENAKTQVNMGTLWRSANLYNASFLFTIGKRYQKQCSDTMASHKHLPLYNHADFEAFYEHIPYDCQLVGVELAESAVSLPRFAHPERAIYLLGAEDNGLSKTALQKCHHLIQIPACKEFSMNVSVAGSIIMYDRFAKNLI